MKRQNIIFIGLGILVIAIIGAVVFSLNRPGDTNTTLSHGMTFADARRMPVSAKCLAADSTLTISASERSTVEQSAMAHLFDVPAGTNVDILIATYSQDQVTGSAIYPEEYGSYNFTMNKQTNGDWQFSKFKRCG